MVCCPICVFCSFYMSFPFYMSFASYVFCLICLFPYMSFALYVSCLISLLPYIHFVHLFPKTKHAKRHARRHATKDMHNDTTKQKTSKTRHAQRHAHTHHIFSSSPQDIRMLKQPMLGNKPLVQHNVGHLHSRPSLAAMRQLPHVAHVNLKLA